MGGRASDRYYQYAPHHDTQTHTASAYFWRGPSSGWRDGARSGWFRLYLVFYGGILWCTGVNPCQILNLGVHSASSYVILVTIQS